MTDVAPAASYAAFGRGKVRNDAGRYVSIMVRLWSEVR